ncbi:hypothetical protein [Flammeovirga sp. SJP92]|uniref:hypothetical protein n=1 Tax=Flammeovirga sp. SJP92 TaxID=1775430 RepID=UPI000786E5A1|nr:hypothetical protein [Flammeovirga sp. SJP92]KXX71895.1 hypothetical protein AVL50_03680 [Flammeovirga sp. SJP92]
MKNILYFIITLLTAFTTVQAQEKQGDSMKDADFTIKSPKVNFDPSIELKVLRNANCITVKDNCIYFSSDNKKETESFKLEFQSFSDENDVSYARYNLYRGPFRRLQIKYKKLKEDQFTCTLQFFDLSGRVMYTVESDQLKMHEELVSKGNNKDVK